MVLVIYVFSRVTPVPLGEVLFNDNQLYMQLDHATPTEYEGAKRMIDEGIDPYNAYFSCMQWYRLEGELMRFQAGSHAELHTWRSNLHMLRRNKEFESIPSYADTEGYIDATACKTLYEDFLVYKGMVERNYRGSHFLSHYRDWMRACKLATEGGFIYYQ